MRTRQSELSLSQAASIFDDSPVFCQGINSERPVTSNSPGRSSTPTEEQRVEDKTEETPAQRAVLPARASAQAVLRSAAISAECVCLYLYEDLPGE